MWGGQIANHLVTNVLEICGDGTTTRAQEKERVARAGGGRMGWRSVGRREEGGREGRRKGERERGGAAWGTNIEIPNAWSAVPLGTAVESVSFGPTVTKFGTPRSMTRAL